MTRLLLACQTLARLTPEAAAELEIAWTQKNVQKNEVILDSGRICSDLYFIESGLVKLFADAPDKPFIMRFACEQEFITVIDSFITQQPSRYQLVALEPAQLGVISKAAVNRLSAAHHCLEHFFRNLTGLAAIHMMQRIHELLEDDASVRYRHFVGQHPALLQRVKLGELAAYLGITQTTLSRIRATR